MNTHNIPFSIEKKKITLNYPKLAVMRFFLKGLKDEFETAVVNEPSVFEPLKFYCMCFIVLSSQALHNLNVTFLVLTTPKPFLWSNA